MRDFPAWTAVTLGGVLLCTWWLPDVREKHAHEQAVKEPIARCCASRRCAGFASLFFHVMAHFAIYGFLSLYLDARWAKARP